MAYYELLTGFRKASFMTVDEVEAHAKKYSQSYKKGFGVWKDNFDAMAKKTVIKLLLSKFAPLSTQMEQALADDQKATEDYIDNKVSFDVSNMAIEDELIDIEPDDLSQYSDEIF
jgi:recombination protein RecT